MTLSGGALTVGGGSTLTVVNGAGNSATLATALAGTGALVKSGAGALTLSGSNGGHSGSVSVNPIELLFELISQRYERGSTLITSNLPFDEWTETFGSERLTGALLDRLTHHVSILEMNGESYRLAQSQARKARPNP